MLIKLVVVGKLKDRMLQSRCDEFAKWLTAHNKIQVQELPDSSVEKEGEAILKQVEKNSRLIVLSEEGETHTSREFAAMLEKIDSKIIFVIGGPYGLSPEVKHRADHLLSLSKMTFTHELARLLLLEQLFRASSIQNGGKYHND